MKNGPILPHLMVSVLVTALMVPACSGRVDTGNRRTAVASVYPLAWLVSRIGGDSVSVTDLTPPGVDAHDAVLTARQRADIENADLVVYLGQIGFQPDVEQAIASDANGRVVDVSSGGALLSAGGGVKYDPHVWLDPVKMAGFAAQIGDALRAVDPANSSVYSAREASTIADLTGLYEDLKKGLASCKYDTFVVSHEAFGYLAAATGLHEIGIQGLVPESEPSADRIRAAGSAISSGQAAPVVFYENTDEGKRIAGSVAADAGVPTMPLYTLESAPSSGDYLSLMRENLSALRNGLQCE